MATLKIDFYRVNISDTSSFAFEKLIEDACNINDRTLTIRYVPVRLHLATSINNGEFWQGEIIRIRMVNAPPKVRLSGELEEIPLEDDQGLGERTAFLYHPQTRVLLLHNTHTGVSASVIAKYFETLFNLESQIMAEVVINADAMRKLARMRSVTKFEIHAAGLDSTSIFRDDDLGVDELRRLYESFRAPKISLILSVGHQKDSSIIIDNVRKLASRWSDLTDKYLHSKNRKNNDYFTERANVIRISGSVTDEEGETEENVCIDMIKDRMRESIDFDYQGRRSITYDERQSVLNQAWQRRSTELRRMFTSTR